MSDRFPAVDASGFGSKQSSPRRPDKVHFQFDGREGLIRLHDGGVCRSDGGIRQLAEEPAMNRALLVAVNLRVRLNSDDGPLFVDVDDVELQGLRYSGRISHMRGVYRFGIGNVSL